MTENNASAALVAVEPDTSGIVARTARNLTATEAYQEWTRDNEGDNVRQADCKLSDVRALLCGQ